MFGRPDLQATRKLGRRSGDCGAGEDDSTIHLLADRIIIIHSPKKRIIGIFDLCSATIGRIGH
jgi:hypothetical protein